MKEELLHYAWKTKRFNSLNLKSTQGDKVEILDFGVHNQDAGPDFSQCKIRIGHNLWAGNVEMHSKSSQWYAHGHDDDPNYKTVILHVVYEDDRPVLMPNHEPIPTIILDGRIDKSLFENYSRLKQNTAWIPCEKSIHSVPEIIKEIWLDRLMIERLEKKTDSIQRLLELTDQDWEESFFRSLCRNLGLKVNGYPFEALAESISLKTILKYKQNHTQIEALLFGQAGMLERDFEEEYPNLLKREYGLLKHKHKLKNIDGSIWKFMRLRPANFPSIRLAQLAQLLYQSNHLFSKILAAKNVKEVENMFSVKLANYWKTHYLLDRKSTNRTKSLGKSTIHLILINTIVPFLFHYGKWRKEDKYIDQALDFLRSCPPEQNVIIKKWKGLGLEASSAHKTQSLLQLKNEYCLKKRCLNCSIGHSILK